MQIHLSIRQLVVAGALLVLTSFTSAHADTITVNSTEDPSGFNAGIVIADLGTIITFRDAFNAACNTSGEHTIHFAPELAGETIFLSQVGLGGSYKTALALENQTDNQQPANVNIVGPVDGGIAFAPGGDFGLGGTDKMRFMRCGTVATASFLTMSNVTIKNWGDYADNTALWGGAFFILNAEVNLNGCTLADNQAYAGGAFYIPNSAITTLKLNMINCTLIRNSAWDQGGAIYNRMGFLELTHCTITSNDALQGGGIWSEPRIPMLKNTIVAGNTASLTFGVPNLGPFPPEGNNNIIAGNPGIGFLQDNGGPTMTCALLNGSPAIDAGVVITGIDVDQRGFARSEGFAPDIGAYEARIAAAPTFSITDHMTQASDVAFDLFSVSGANPIGGVFSGQGVSGNQFDPATAAAGIHVITYTVLSPDAIETSATFTITVTETPGLIVTTHADVNSPTDGQTSLREAVKHAAMLPGPQIITFAPALAGNVVTLTDGWNDPNDSTALVVTTNLTIQGLATSPGITISMDPGVTRRHLHVLGAGGNLTVTHLTFTGGRGGSHGGSIWSQASLTVRHCSFTDNTALAEGGAIQSWGDTPLCLIENSTFTGNTSNGHSSAINAGATSIILRHVTITGNSATNNLGALVIWKNSATIMNTILADTTDGTVGFTNGGSLSAQSANNILGVGGTGGLVDGVNGNQLGVSLASMNLGPLAANGGPTPTMALMDGSPAINAGAILAEVTTDQRGQPRDLLPDVGAFEFPSSPAIFTSANNVLFLTGRDSVFNVTASGSPAPSFTTASALPDGITLSAAGVLSGTPTASADGVYAVTIVARNQVWADAIQNFTITVLNPEVLAARPAFNNGTGWTYNRTIEAAPVAAGPMISGNVLTLTNFTQHDARSAWFRIPLHVKSFRTSFIYQDVGGGGAWGATFTIHNDPRGIAAQSPSGLGNIGIMPSFSLGFQLAESGAGFVNGLRYGNGGSFGPLQSTVPVNIANGNPILVEMLYVGGALKISLTDTVSSASFTTDHPVDIPGLVGDDVAYVGFTATAPGLSSNQTITDFNFIPLTDLKLDALEGGALVLSWPAAIYGYHLQRNTNLESTNWVDVDAPVIQSNGMKQVSVNVNPTLKSEFFRLRLP